MSRAFTKEDDAGDDLPELPVSPGPNYVTPRGLDLLKSAAQELAERRKAARAAAKEIKHIDRDLRYLEARINAAIVVPLGKGPEARFGATVTLQDEAGERHTYRIVGEDEARTDPNLLPWSSPLAQALLGAKAGDSISWKGSPRYTLLSVEYLPQAIE
jgi:transcription elongation GreA/GreB family factor